MRENDQKNSNIQGCALSERNWSMPWMIIYGNISLCCFGAGSGAFLYILCTDKQYDTAGHLPKRFLIHTMKLVGARVGIHPRTIPPEKCMERSIGSHVADSILMGTAYWAVTYEQELIQVITPEVMLIVCSKRIGIWNCDNVVMCYFSMNKYLRMKANSLYYIWDGEMQTCV